MTRVVVNRRVFAGNLHSTPFPCTNVKSLLNPPTSRSGVPEVGGHSGANEGRSEVPHAHRFRRALIEIVKLLDKGDVETARALILGLLVSANAR
jgi:hypothetical protein